MSHHIVGLSLAIATELPVRRFGVAFHLLLREDPGLAFSHSGSADAAIDDAEMAKFGYTFKPWAGVFRAAVTEIGMALGAFEVDDFRQAAQPTLSVFIFLIFLFIVPIVMLNALIAIMVRMTSDLTIQ